MTRKTCVFTVKGAFPFPLDMLRYDACYPHSQAAVATISETLDPHLRHQARSERGFTKDTFSVKLVSQLIVNPTKDRWESFGWKVTEVTMQ